MRQREAGVDLLRALCALLVVAIHLFPITAQVNREPAALSPLPVLPLIWLQMVHSLFSRLSGRLLRQ